jgi:hypothetical protein
VATLDAAKGMYYFIGYNETNSVQGILLLRVFNVS